MQNGDRNVQPSNPAPIGWAAPRAFFSKAGDQEISPGYHKHDPPLLPKETKRKEKQKDFLNISVSCLLIVSTGQT